MAIEVDEFRNLNQRQPQQVVRYWLRQAADALWTAHSRSPRRSLGFGVLPERPLSFSSVFSASMSEPGGCLRKDFLIPESSHAHSQDGQPRVYIPYAAITQMDGKHRRFTGTGGLGFRVLRTP